MTAGGGEPAAALPASAERVRQALAARGIAAEIRVLAASTRTAAEAAAALGCGVAQIAKSLVFRAPASDRAVLVIASGAHRVREEAVAAALGEPIARADAAFVRERTGFAIGGVPPIGHRTAPAVFVDAALLDHPVVWAAAGTPNAVFPIAPAALAALAEGTVIALA